MPRVFISHSSLDHELVEREIISPLRAHGVETWYSTDNIKSASEWERQIREGLKDSDWFLIALSPRSVSSEWVGREVHWAFLKRKQRIVPVMLETCEPDELHLGLLPLQFIDFRNDVAKARDQLLAVWGLNDAAQAETLYQDAQDALAREEWGAAAEGLQAVLRLDPAHPRAGAELERARQRMELEELYASGREHLRAERWREALKSFRRVRAIDKGYGGVADLIAEADAGLEEEETRGSEEREEEERKAYKGSQRVHVVDKSYGSVADLIAEANARRGDEKARRSEREEEERKAKEEARRRDVEAKEEAARRELERLEKESGERQAKERLYSEALEVFDRKDWGAAREKLRAAEAADPGNKEITAKLAEVERQQKLATLFDGGMRHMKDGRWAEALDAFQQVRKEAGYYKNVSIQIARAETGLRRLREKERERPSQHAAGETARTGQEKTDPAPERIADSTDEKPTPVTRPTPYTGPMFAVNTTPDADDSRFQFLVVGAVLLITLLIITAFVLWGEG